MKSVVYEFQPDIIVEATNACDRVCPGCYAPNIVISKTNPTANPSANYLSLNTLRHNWPARNKVESVSIRGGEPTLNPELPGILEFLGEKATNIFLETNGSWIFGSSPELIVSIKASDVIVKLSVDSMHGNKASDVTKMINLLNGHGIQVVVAVTEVTEDSFNKSRLRLLPDFNGAVIWQKKVNTISDLIRPRTGVITTKGEFKETVTNKFALSPGKAALSAILCSVLSFSFASSGVAHAQQNVTVGIAANFSAMSDSTSNPYANYFRNAIEMAFSEKADALKAKGISVTLKEFDYSDDKLKVIDTANAAVKSDALAVIGYIYSSDTLLAGPILNKNKLLLITPTATADRVEEIGHFVRRTCFNDSYQGRIIADYAFKNKKIKNVGIVSVADCAYCQSLRNAFKERFEALGGKVTVDKSILSNDTNVDDLPESFRNKKLDAIFLPNYERISATVISKLYDAGIKPKVWLGGDGWGNSVDLFSRILGKRKYKAFTVSHWHSDAPNPKSKFFYNEFLRRYKKPPVDTAVLAYDSALLLIEGLLNAKTLTREGIRESVEKIRRFEGVTGTMTYPASGRTPSKPAVILRLENGKLNVEQMVGG